MPRDANPGKVLPRAGAPCYPGAMRGMFTIACEWAWLMLFGATFEAYRRDTRKLAPFVW